MTTQQRKYSVSLGDTWKYEKKGEPQSKRWYDTKFSCRATVENLLAWKQCRVVATVVACTQLFSIHLQFFDVAFSYCRLSFKLIELFLNRYIRMLQIIFTVSGYERCTKICSAIGSTLKFPPSTVATTFELISFCCTRIAAMQMQSRLHTFVFNRSYSFICLAHFLPQNPGKIVPFMITKT